MINGITYFRKNSPYVGDVTKNCGLDGYEVDNNFFVLEGRDVKSLQVIGNDIVITLLNGDSFRATIEALKDIEVLRHSMITDIEFDKERGILKVTKDGETVGISGFSTLLNTGVTVAVDETLHGTGIPSDPVGISSLHRTGQYRPVKEIVSIVDGEKLPSDTSSLRIGERYVTKESISDYGYLYNYDAVKKIACDLAATNSPWRIPTKEDWDGMLNAVEPCHGDRNHTSASANRYFGRWSGKLLKSSDLWYHKGTTEESNCCGQTTCIDYDTMCNNTSNKCNCDNNCESTYCGKSNECNCVTHFNTDGLDAFGFRVTPAGYADDAKNIGFFGERAFFWTATNSQCENVYAKRFEFNRNSVYQNIIAGQNFLSLRLVKSYTGDNFYENEEILGSYYPTVLMPSLNNGSTVWTAVNIAYCCNCGCRLNPNDGQNLSSTTHYYVNEWDGKRWKRNELKDGESVVVIKSPDGKKNVEYRVIGEDFVDITSITYNDVINDVQERLDGITEKIEDEINRSTNKDDEFDNIVNNELRPDIRKNATHITVVNDNLVTAVDTINKSIKTVNDNLVDAINTINGGIATEIQERKDADKVLEDSIANIEKTIEDEIKRSVAKDDLLEAKDKELEEAIKEFSNINDERYNELSEKIEQNKSSIEGLTEKTTTLESDLSNAQKVFEDFSEDVANTFEEIKNDLSTEIQERKNDGLIKDGTLFNTSNGILTLKSKGSTNDIEVQFSMDFGEF